MGSMRRIKMFKRAVKILAAVNIAVCMSLFLIPNAHADSSINCSDGTIVTTNGMTQAQIQNACVNHSGGVSAADLTCSGNDISPCKDRCDAAIAAGKATAAGEGYVWHIAAPDGSTPGYCQALTTANAGGSSCATDSNGTAINGASCISSDIQKILNFAIAGVGIIVVIMILIGGVQYAVSRDNPQAVQAAKTKITNAVIAMICFIFIYAFLQWVVPGGIF
jgi:hypothetical protein